MRNGGGGWIIIGRESERGEDLEGGPGHFMHILHLGLLGEHNTRKAIFANIRDGMMKQGKQADYEKD